MAPLPQPTPPGIPSGSQSQVLLAGLTVKASGSKSGYARDLFPTWDTISGTCNTREYVLKRDGTGVVTNSACTATSGSWYSPYDGATWTATSDLDIDHMVPLANAWVSGASSWTTSQREAFANDVSRPQLWAVTDNVNESKGDSSPDEWKPPLTSFYCTYAEAWVEVKSYYSLSITSAEKAALTSMLGTCGKNSVESPTTTTLSSRTTTPTPTPTQTQAPASTTSPVPSRGNPRWSTWSLKDLTLFGVLIAGLTVNM